MRRTAILALLTLLCTTSPAAAGPGGPDPARSYAVPVGAAPQRGPSDAKLTIVMFSELGCRFCAKVQPTLAQLERKYGKDVRLVWRGFVVHLDARAAHVAAAAAAAQGKFWAFHDRYYAWYAQNPKLADPATVRQLAAEAGLDLAALDAFVLSGKASAIVDADQALGESFGVTGTPTFFINGRWLGGAQPLEAFTRLCDEELARASALRAEHPDANVYERVLATGERGVPRALGATAPGRRGPDPAKTYAVPVGTSPVKGAADARITIVEFADWKCPFCARAQPTLVALEKKYGLKLRVVFKQLVIHPKDAKPVARAATAVAAQGKFWEWSARVWPEWEKVDAARARQLAAEVGCDLKAYDQYVAAAFGDSDLDDDRRLAARLGVTGTPTFFINGRVLSGAQPLASFEALVDEELKKIDAWRAAGGKGAPYDHVLEVGEKPATE